jgi:hypothetical protein
VISTSPLAIRTLRFAQLSVLKTTGRTTRPIFALMFAQYLLTYMLITSLTAVSIAVLREATGLPLQIELPEDASQNAHKDTLPSTRLNAATQAVLLENTLIPLSGFALQTVLSGLTTTKLQLELAYFNVQLCLQSPINSTPTTLASIPIPQIPILAVQLPSGQIPPTIHALSYVPTPISQTKTSSFVCRPAQ